MLNAKTLQKGISAVTMFATVVCLSGVSMLAPLTASAATIVDGDIVKSNATNSDGTPAISSLDVYIVKTVGTKKFKRLVLNPNIFASYGHLKWENIKTVTQAEIDGYTTSSLVRVDGDSKVYALTPVTGGDTGAKSWVNVTAEQFIDEANSDPDSIYTINSVDSAAYSAKADITTVQQLEDFYEDGTLPAGVASGDLNAALASSTPATTSLPKSAQYAPFTTLNLTAGEEDVTVTGLTVKRTGLGNYADFDKIFVVSDGTIRGSLKSLSSEDEVTLNFATGSGPIEVSAGQSEKVTVYANMAAGTAGDVNALQVTAIESSAATVAGLPIKGNEMSVGSTNAPTAKFESVAVSTSRAIGDTNVDVAKVKITNTNTSEDISVNAITFKSGTPGSGTKIDNDDIANFELFDGTTSISDEAELDASGYVTLTLDDPIVIAKGGSKYATLTLKADILGGPDRRIAMDIYRTVDLDITGNTNDFRTNNSDLTFTATTIIVANADLAVTLASDTPKAQTIVDEQTVTLLNGTLTAGQGDVTVTGMRVNLSGNDLDFGATDEYENLKVYVDGVLVSTATGSEISTSDNQTSIDVDFTDEFSVSGTAELEVTIGIKTVSDSDWIKATVPGGNMTATRDFDDAVITPSGTATGNKQTIGNAALSVTLAAVPVSSTRVKGASDIEFFGFNLVAGSGDDVTVTDLTLELDSSTGTEVKADVSNVEIYASNGTTLIAGPKNLNSAKQAVFTGLDIDLAAGTSTKFIVKADVNSTINDTITPLTTLNLEFADITAQDGQGDDITTITGGNSGTLVNSAAVTNVTLVDRGTLNVELSTSTPKTHQVMASTTGDESTKVKFTAGYEEVLIKKLILTAAAGAAADDEIAKVTLMDGSTVVASTEAISSGVATLTIPEANWVTIPKDGDKTLTVVTDYNSTDSNVAESGAVVQWKINNLATDVEAAGSVKDVYGAVTSATGTGVTVTLNADETTAAASYTDSQTSMTMVSTALFAAGNILLLDEAGDGVYTSADDEYVLITEVTSATTVTVRRGVAGSTAKSIVFTNLDIAEATQLLTGNSTLVYSNLPTVSSTTNPTGALVAGTYDVFKFVVADKTNGEQPIRLDEVKIRVDGTGMSAANGWNIANAYLYNGSNQVGATYTTDVTASGDITFTTLETDDDAIIDGSTTFTVRVEIASVGTGFVAGNTAQFSIDSFGSANAAGTITGGDLDWQDDANAGTAIEWIDTTLTSIQGNVFRFTTS